MRLVKRAFDPTMASMFRIEWLVPLDETTRDDYTRAVAEKAEPLLRAARFVSDAQLHGPHDVEIRVWAEAACGNACVSVTWEPGAGAYGFHLMDESLRERLACVVFDELPCIDAQESLGQGDAILDAAMQALAVDPRADIDKLAQRVREAKRTRRVPVEEGAAAPRKRKAKKRAKKE